MSVEKYINQTFAEMHQARKYMIDRGFNMFSEKFVDMGEGFEHIWTWDYRHNSEDRICRLCDLRWAQRKALDTDRIPKLIGFIQVSIKNIDTIQ